MTPSVMFWSIVAVLLVIAFVGVYWAFVGRMARTTDESRAEVTRDLLRQELDLLKAEKDMAILTPELYDQSVQDINRRALEELEEQQHGPAAKRIPAWSGALVGLLAALCAVTLYLQLGSPKLVPFIDEVRHQGLLLPDGTLAENQQRINPDHLKAYLEDNGTDERALVLYARMMAEQKNWTEAVRVYKQAIDLDRLVAHDHEVMLEYVASCISSKTPENMATAKSVLNTMVAQDPKQYRAREMLAILAMETQQWSEAVPHLEALLDLLQPTDPMYERIAQTIQFVHRLAEREAGRQ